MYCSLIKEIYVTLMCLPVRENTIKCSGDKKRWEGRTNKSKIKNSYDKKCGNIRIDECETKLRNKGSEFQTWIVW